MDWSHFRRRHQRKLKGIGVGQQVTFLLPKHLAMNIWKFAFLEIEMHGRCMLKACVETHSDIYRVASFFAFWCIEYFHILVLADLKRFTYSWKRNELNVYCAMSKTKIEWPKFGSDSQASSRVSASKQSLYRARNAFQFQRIRNICINTNSGWNKSKLVSMWSG